MAQYPILSIGQWQGFFRYGPEYGFLEGQEAEFRLFIEEFNNGQFTGRIIDWEGLGADGQVSQVKGFINKGFISFVKQYACLHAFDDYGNNLEAPDIPGHKVVYEGRFDEKLNVFTGKWEISIEVEHTSGWTLEEVSSGTWHMQGINPGQDPIPY